jgi:hypothetical protein
MKKLIFILSTLISITAFGNNNDCLKFNNGIYEHRWSNVRLDDRSN